MTSPAGPPDPGAAGDPGEDAPHHAPGARSTPRADAPNTDVAVRALLADGEIDIKGRMPWSSNATFLVEVSREGSSVAAVYKPGRGEQSLWDFPGGLYKREVAAWELASWIGWEIIPLTILRNDGPLGEGSLQRFVDADFAQHYFTIQDEEALRPTFQRLCIFDILANNTDRKSGHVLIDADRQAWGIDNGLSFHHEFKLRTVIWEWAGEPVPDAILDEVASLIDRGLPPSLTRLLDTFERDAVVTRARAVLHEGCFPVDPTGRRHPWPLV